MKQHPPQGQLGGISEILGPLKNLPKSDQSQPELPGFQCAPEVTDPALTAARRPRCRLFARSKKGRRVMAASKSPKNGKPKKARKKSAEVEAKPKKLSALDAAAQVLAETGQPMA